MREWYTYHQPARTLHRAPYPRVGAITPTGSQEPQPVQNSDETLMGGLRRITPALILGGIVTGAAFAIGSGIVAKYLFSPRSR